jgi:hypothetical protein
VSDSGSLCRPLFFRDRRADRRVRAHGIKPLSHSSTRPEIIFVIDGGTIVTGGSEGRGHGCFMVDSAPAASPTNEEEYPQADSGSRKPNNQKDTSDSTFVVQEPMSRHINTS